MDEDWPEVKSPPANIGQLAVLNRPTTPIKVGDLVQVFGERGRVHSLAIGVAGVLYDGCTEQAFEDITDLVKIGGDV